MKGRTNVPFFSSEMRITIGPACGIIHGMDRHKFSNQARLPGTTTSFFDTLLRLDAFVQKIPTPVFAGLLFVFALYPSLGNLQLAFLLWVFFIIDWISIRLLSYTHKSYGPAKPPTLMLAMLRLPFALLPLPLNMIAQFAGTLLVVYGFWIEPHYVHVTKQTMQSAKLKLGVPPLRVLHLGDLHVERITQRERKVVELARSLKPDVILFSGDFLNLSNVHDPVSWEHARTILGELDAPLGVFAVSGSPPVDQLPIVGKLLEGLSIRWLRNERVSLSHHGEAIDIVGITCTHKPHEDGADLDAILQGDPEDFTILLYHTPDLAPEAAAQGVDLQLSGHTHGGQVRLPIFGALYTSSLYGKRFEMGRYNVKDMTLYVTRGIGLEGKGAPRVRFLCPPEVVIWEISAS